MARKARDEMPDNQADISEAGQDMRQALRLATREDHERLDARMGACDLATRHGMSRFLMAHAIGLAAVAPLAARFLRDTLHLDMPDVEAMIAQDLQDLGCAVPPLAPLPAEGMAGAAYVLIGSRLGTATLRTRGYWSPGVADFSRYMEDRSLLALWPPLLAWLRDCPLPDTERQLALATARASFAAFEQGLHLAQTLPLPADEAATPA